MPSHELHDRLLEDAQRYDAGRQTRSLLAPYRDVLLLQRAKFMSYEQIAATLARHGLSISPAAVGCFCRQQFTKTEIEGVRRSVRTVRPGVPPTAPSPLPPGVPEPGRRGPKIARKDF